MNPLKKETSSHYKYPLPVLALLFYGIFTALQLITWLKYIGIPSARHGDYSVINLVSLSSVHITIFIGSILLALKIKHATNLFIISAVLGTAGILKMIFLGPSENVFIAPPPERMLIIVSAILYCLHLKNKRYYD